VGGQQFEGLLEGGGYRVVERWRFHGGVASSSLSRWGWRV
jgi:hypothetical protein